MFSLHQKHRRTFNWSLSHPSVPVPLLCSWMRQSTVSLIIPRDNQNQQPSWHVDSDLICKTWKTVEIRKDEMDLRSVVGRGDSVKWRPTQKRRKETNTWFVGLPFNFIRLSSPSSVHFTRCVGGTFRGEIVAEKRVCGVPSSFCTTSRGTNGKSKTQNKHK